MKTILLLISLLIATTTIGQDFVMSFTNGSDDIPLDSIIARNQRTGEEITITSGQNLVLATSSRLTEIETQGILTRAYPNPFSSITNFTFTLSNSSEARIKLVNQLGQVIEQQLVNAAAGNNNFVLTVPDAGIYFVIVQLPNAEITQRIISTKGNKSSKGIQYLGNGSVYYQQKRIKTDPNSPSLEFILGDCIRYFCYGDVHCTIFQEEPRSPRDYKVIFHPCVDPNNRSYRTVTIGDQVWMAENMAYLPSVNGMTDESGTEPRYYVYGYDGTDHAEAKGLANYADYGVLYNLDAAAIVCPAGWHLPSCPECGILEKHLGMNSRDLNIGGWRASGDVGKKLKSITSWDNNGSGIDLVGWNGIPAGWQGNGIFNEGGQTFVIWTSSTVGQTTAYIRWIESGQDGIFKGTSGNKYGGSVRCIKDH